MTAVTKRKVKSQKYLFLVCYQTIQQRTYENPVNDNCPFKVVQSEFLT